MEPLRGLRQSPQAPLAKSLPQQYHTPLFWPSPVVDLVAGIQGNRMANIASAKKRARQAVKRREHNASLRSELRTMIKKVRKSIGAGDKKAALVEFQASQSRIDAITDKKIIHKNTAARQKSRLSAAIKAMA